MTDYNRYDDGQMVRISASFEDGNHTPADPTAIELRYKNPQTDVVTVETYPGDIVKDDTGEYHFDLDTTNFNKGTWHYKWVGTGSVTAATSWAFIIKNEETPP